MERIDLKQLGLTELSHQEMVEINGGGIWADLWRGAGRYFAGFVDYLMKGNHSMPFDAEGKVNFL